MFQVSPQQLSVLESSASVADADVACVALLVHLGFEHRFILVARLVLGLLMWRRGRELEVSLVGTVSPGCDMCVSQWAHLTLCLSGDGT